MIMNLVRLSALYLVVYIYVRHTSGREMALAIKWLAVVSLGLMILSCTLAPLKQFSDDIHSIAMTYSGGKEKVSNALGIENNNETMDVGYKNIWERYLGAKFDWPIKGKITQGYNEHNHGLDIAGNLGDVIKASRTGKVEKVINSEGPYGLHVIIDHGNSYETLYAHCSKVVVMEGKMVFSGEKIAEIGSSGNNSTGNHLHFEIRINSKTVDPRSYLK